jgi:hypothetical protein
VEGVGAAAIMLNVVVFVNGRGCAEMSPTDYAPLACEYAAAFPVLRRVLGT